MSHDKKGNEIKVGDLVNVPCRVTAVHAVEEDCNVSLETVEPLYPGDNKSPLHLNAKQVELVEAAQEPKTEEPVAAE